MGSSSGNAAPNRELEETQVDVGFLGVGRMGHAIAAKTFRVGDQPRQANVAKIAGNLMVACAIEAIAEAAVLLRKHAMSAPDVLDMIVESLFAVPVYQGYAHAIGHES